MLCIDTHQGLEKLEVTMEIEMVETGREVLVGDTIKANISIPVNGL